MFNKNVEKLKILGGLAKSLAILCFLMAFSVTALSGANDKVSAGELPSADEVTDFGVAVSLGRPELNIGVHGLGVTTGAQTVRVATGFHLGYRLSVESLTDYGGDGSAMRGGNGKLIAGVTSAGGQNNLASDTWGLRRLTDDQSGNWLGVTNNAPREIMHEDGDYPTSRDVKVEFGINNQALQADSYTIKLRYSVTPLVPTSPAILTATSRHKIGSGDDITLTGVNLNRVTIGVDQNNDGQLTINWDNPKANEGCQKMSDVGIVNDDNHLTCDPPLLLNAAEGDEAAAFKILMRWKDETGQLHTADSGKTLTYYRQPTLAGATYNGQEYSAGGQSLGLTSWSDLDIRQVATAGDVAELLNADGAVFQMGREVDYEGNLNGGVNIDEANVVEYSRALSDNARIVDIVGGLGDGDTSGNDSFIAVSADGKKLYGWGSNKDNRLMVGSGGYFTRPWEVGNHRQSIGSWTRQIAVGKNFFVLLGKGADRPSRDSSDSDKLGLYSWGVDDRYQLGDNANDSNSKNAPKNNPKWPNAAPVPVYFNSKYINDDEYFVKVAAGKCHAMALMQTGRVVTWGCKGDGGSSDGRLGWQTNDDARRIHNISGGYIDSPQNRYRVKEIAAGDNFSATLGEDGRLFAFGGGFPAGTTSELGDNIAGMSARSDMLLAWDKSGVLRRINPPKDGLDTQIAQNVKRAFAGDNYSYYMTTDNRVWRVRNTDVMGSSFGGAIDITDQLKNPTYNVRLKGKNLQYSDVTVWLDRDGDGVADDGEWLDIVHAADDGEYRTVETKLRTQNLAAGTYKLCVKNPYSDTDCGLSVTVEATNTKGNEVKKRTEGERKVTSAKAKPHIDGEQTVEPAETVNEAKLTETALAADSALEPTSAANDVVIDSSKGSKADGEPDGEPNGETKEATSGEEIDNKANESATKDKQDIDTQVKICLAKLIGAKLIKPVNNDQVLDSNTDANANVDASPTHEENTLGGQERADATRGLDTSDPAADNEELQSCLANLLDRKIIEPVVNEPNLYQVTMLYNTYYERRRN